MTGAEARLTYLFNQYMDGSASEDEAEEFLLLVNIDDHKSALLTLMDNYLEGSTFSEGLKEDQKRNILKNIFQAPVVSRTAQFIPVPGAENSLPKDKTLSWTRLLAAALVFLMLAVGTYFIKNQHSPVLYSQYHGKLIPGGNKATLTLADGTKVSLTDATNGKLAEQAGVSIRKTADGQLLYELKEVSSLVQQDKSPILYNTISTPAGGQYQLILPDRTHVWLNAASSLRYPSSFAALKERRVELKGEAYFEVAKLNAGAVHIPFIVASRKQEVEVLGTHFNINSYEDEFAATTLLEGSIRVSRPAVFERVIAPGEQALAGQDLQVIHVDPSTAVAWKNGLFKFENADIYTIMKQFSRWYNVDVVYEGKIPNNKFTGEVYRNMDASKALKILSYAKINFRIEAADHENIRKKIVITPN
ncbi:ferric-dicitrate binding protein FerR (iron transport regulator) [Pedobacter cryoconitis]|uniref:FecR family protein n=1 Tax=Pedobacter cryoconitis TaxID=188932 RepID=UPI001619565C|nr:FecR family protein [Pedobacter cryoconitis]MBB6272267.1 ferric-dicitrate binding protein FerR (iron transport regulator) [Pedobacter cryoconitis]